MARAAQMGKRLVARARGPEDDVPSDEPRVIALDLLPLLAPHKRHGRLGLRVERLPQQTRLTKGTRNNDGSWSLVRDDLEDLEYVVPEGVEAAGSLSIRIISLTGGNTLAVVDFPLDGGEEDETPAPAPAGRSDGGDDAQVQMLRGELNKLKAALADRDKALATAPSADDAEKRVAAEAAKAQAQIEQLKRTYEAEAAERSAKLEARAQELAAEARAAAWREAREAAQKAEAAWREEESARLAAAEAQWQARAASAAAQGRQSDAEMQAVREQLAQAQAALAQREAALSRAKDEAARVVREADEAFAKAQAGWKSEEAARLAAAEAEWQARAAAAAAAGQRSNDELGTLKTQVAELKAAVAQRDAALAQAKDEASRVVRDADAAFAKAQAGWKSEEAARLAAAEAEWQARAAAAAAAGQRSNDELGALKSEVATLKADVAQRDAALVQAKEDAAKVAREVAAWKAEEAQRLAAATAGDEIGAVRKELAAAKVALAERDAALMRAADEVASANDAAAKALAAVADGNALSALTAELAEAKALIAARDMDVAKARDDAAKAVGAQAAAVRELQEKVAALQSSLAEREAALKRAEESARAAAVEAQAREALPAVGESEKDAEIRRWREKAVTLEAKLIKANTATEEERLKWQRDAQDAISRATKEWTAKEAARRSSTEAQVRKEFADQLTLATSRYEAAETALAQIRLVGGKTDATRASIELDSVRAALARREADVFRLRNEVEELRGAPPREDAAAPAPAPASNTKRYIRDAIVAGAIGVAVVVMYPVVDGWMTPPPPPPVIVKAPPPPPPPPPVVKTAKLSVQGRLRAGPSNSTTAMTSLSKGTPVVVLDERDQWVRVRVEGPEAKPGAREGWVAASQLKFDAE